MFSIYVFAYFEIFFMKIPTVKNFSSWGGGNPPYWDSIAPMHTIYIYDLTILITDKCFKTIVRNFFLYHCFKEIKNNEQHRNFLSDIHQNLISSNLYQGATEYKVSSISADKFLRNSVHKILETCI